MNPTRLTASLLSASACALLPPDLHAQSVEQLAGLSIEELAELPVRSASKREEPLSEAPTALYVIIGEPRIGAYVEADGKLSYRLNDLIGLFVAGRNLLHSTHLESNDRQRAQRAMRSVNLGTRLGF